MVVEHLRWPRARDGRTVSTARFQALERSPIGERAFPVRAARVEAAKITERFRAAGSPIARDQLMRAAERNGRVSRPIRVDHCRSCDARKLEPPHRSPAESTSR